MRTRTSRRRHRFTQDYPSERADYPSSERSSLPSPPVPKEEVKPKSGGPAYHPVEGNPDDGGKISPADAERISSEDFPASEVPEEPVRKKAA